MAGVEASTLDPGPSSPTLSRQSISQTPADSSKEDAPRAKAPRRRILGGLDPNAIFATPSVAQSTAGTFDSSECKTSQTLGPTTRGSRHGRTDVNYDMRLHPADDILRPKYASRRKGGLSVKPDTDSEVGTEDDTEDDDEGPHQNEGSDSDDDETDELSDTPLLVRKVDPKSSRHSARPAAKKYVNYSRRFHPQDAGIPGYRMMAKRALLNPEQQQASTSKQSSTKRKACDEVIEISDSEESEVDVRAGRKISKNARFTAEPLSQDSLDVDELVAFTLRASKPATVSERDPSLEIEESDVDDGAISEALTSPFLGPGLNGYAHGIEQAAGDLNAAAGCSNEEDTTTDFERLMQSLAETDNALDHHSAGQITRIEDVQDDGNSPSNSSEQPTAEATSSIDKPQNDDEHPKRSEALPTSQASSEHQRAIIEIESSTIASSPSV